MSVSVEFYPDALNTLVQPGGAVYEDMYRRAFLCLQQARLYAPVDTGRLRASGELQANTIMPGGWDVVFPVNYAWFVDQGTRFMAAREFLSRAVVAAL